MSDDAQTPVNPNSEQYSLFLAANNYVRAFRLMDSAIIDGINVHGAISKLVGATDNLRQAINTDTQIQPMSIDECREQLQAIGVKDFKYSLSQDADYALMPNVSDTAAIKTKAAAIIEKYLRDNIKLT